MYDIYTCCIHIMYTISCLPQALQQAPWDLGRCLSNSCPYLSLIFGLSLRVCRRWWVCEGIGWSVGGVGEYWLLFGFQVPDPGSSASSAGTSLGPLTVQSSGKHPCTSSDAHNPGQWQFSSILIRRYPLRPQAQGV